MRLQIMTGKKKYIFLFIVFALAMLSGCAASSGPDGAEEGAGEAFGESVPESEDTGKEPEDTGKEPEDTGKEPEDTGKEPEDTGKEPEDTGEEPDENVQSFDIPEDWVQVAMSIYLAVEEEEGLRTERMFAVVPDTDEPVPLRSMTVQEDTGIVQIWDEVHDRELFSWKAAFDESGRPENQDYYEHLFRGGLPSIWDCDEEDGIEACLFTEDGVENREFADKEEMLKALGFAGQEPFYEYVNPWGELEVELYYDGALQKGCGFYYSHQMDYKLQDIVQTCGFGFEGIEHRDFSHDPYRLEADDGGTGSEFGLEDYTETYQYRADGRLKHFLSEGMYSHEGCAYEMTKLLELTYLYRDDGSLAYRDYYHNVLFWGTSGMSADGYYDERGRLVQEGSYITHGHIDRYYMYTENGREPDYCLVIDTEGTYGASLIAY